VLDFVSACFFFPAVRPLTSPSADSSPLKTIASAAEHDAGTQQHPSQNAQPESADQQAQHPSLVRPVQEPRSGDQVVDDIERELELQHQRQQQDVVTAAMQAMGALPPNAVFKVSAPLTHAYCTSAQ
jgi:hypothetical protein